MPAAFQRSEPTAALVRYLAACDKGTRVAYRELTDLVGVPIAAQTTYLTSARKILERDHAAVWVCIMPNVGVYRLHDPEIAERQRAWFLFGARNKLAAGARQADLVDLGQLDIAQQARFATDSIIREIAREALARATQRRIEKVARGTSNDLPQFNAIEWMISLSPRRAGELTARGKPTERTPQDDAATDQR
jgi:hypothetical protein